jgi:hypothetical protein
VAKAAREDAGGGGSKGPKVESLAAATSVERAYATLPEQRGDGVHRRTVHLVPKAKSTWVKRR